MAQESFAGIVGIIIGCAMVYQVADRGGHWLYAFVGAPLVGCGGYLIYDYLLAFGR